MAEGAVLLLVNERGDRRLLWELLDGEEFEAIYAAKDVAQARSMLAQDNGVALVVLEVGSGDADVRATSHGSLPSWRPRAWIPCPPAGA